MYEYSYSYNAGSTGKMHGPPKKMTACVRKVKELVMAIKAGKVQQQTSIYNVMCYNGKGIVYNGNKSRRSTTVNKYNVMCYNGKGIVYNGNKSRRSTTVNKYNVMCYNGKGIVYNGNKSSKQVKDYTW